MNLKDALKRNSKYHFVYNFADLTPCVRPLTPCVRPLVLLASEDIHKKQASKSLYNQILKDEKLAAQFTPDDIKDLAKGKTPENYTWHHHQDIGRMQLVDQKIHKETGHVGGYEIWGPGRRKK